MGNASIMKDANSVEWLWCSPVYLQKKFMLSFSPGHSGNQSIKKSISGFSWSLLVNSILKKNPLWLSGVAHTTDLWQLWAFCYHLLSSLVFLAHFFLHTQNSTKTIFWPQVCLLLPVKHPPQAIQMGFWRASVFFYYLNSDLSVWSRGWL